MSNVNFSEYNRVHLPRAEHLVCFVKGIKHAMQKTSDYTGALHQLKCIGFDDNFIEDMCLVADDYKEYHKARIKAEQTANLPENQYPFVRKERLEQFVENRKLILALHAHADVDELLSQISDAVSEELEVNANAFLLAYMTGDVDLMVSALTGWDLEALMAKAKIIPDDKGYFYKTGDFPETQIAFPLYGKLELSVAEFKTYLFNNCSIHDDTWKMVQSVINFVKASCQDAEGQVNLLWAVLKDYGIPEEVVRMVKLQ